MPVFAFGKHKGKDFSDPTIDVSYFEWLITTRQEDIKLYQGEIDRRAAAEVASLSMTERIVQEGYKALAKKLHPDVGGSTVEFQELQGSYQQLKGIMAEVKGVSST